MRYKSLLLLCICLSTSLVLTGQIEDSKSEIEFEKGIEYSPTADLLFLCHPTVNQNPEENLSKSEWKDAILVSTNQKYFKVKAQYSLSNEEIQLLISDKSYSVYKHEMDKIIFDDRIFKTVTYRTKKGKESQAIMEQLCQGYFTLLALRKIGNKGFPLTELYTQTQDLEAQYLIAKKAEVLNYFSKHQFYPDTYVKEAKLNLKEPIDIQKLFIHANKTALH